MLPLPPELFRSAVSSCGSNFIDVLALGDCCELAQKKLFFTC